MHTRMTGERISTVRLSVVFPRSRCAPKINHAAPPGTPLELEEAGQVPVGSKRITENPSQAKRKKENKKKKEKKSEIRQYTAHMQHPLRETGASSLHGAPVHTEAVRDRQ